MLKNACWLQKNAISFQNLHAENIKSLLIEKKNSLIMMQIYVSWNFSAKYFGACFELMTTISYADTHR